MSNPTLQKANGKYLWWSLLALGFQHDAAASGKANLKHISLGMNMFDKPNKDAFQIVTHFLLEKLNPIRFRDAYRHCWPVLDHKADQEFRKITCAWLREIMDENGSAGPKVVASLFQSPGGPKFTSLMLHLAKYVMLQDMKTMSSDDSWVPEAAAIPASSTLMAMKRFQLTKTRFLKAAVDQDHVLQEYQRQAQSQVKSLREERAKAAKYDELLQHHKGDAAQEEPSPAQRIQKVRSLWSAVDGMLSTIKEERQVMECVLGGGVDQYTLDGMDFNLQIPRVLLEKMERLPQHSSVGKMYEAGQLNPLAVLELMNHALQLLKEERFRADSRAPLPQLQPHHLQEKRLQMARALEDLRLMRQKITREEIPEVRSAIGKLEAEWDRKWAEILRDTPLTSFLNDDPALGLLSPMAPLSFELATEAGFSSCVFSQFPAKFLEFPEEEPAETKPQEEVATIYSDNISSPPRAERAETPVAAAEVCARPSALLRELNEMTPTVPVKTATPPPPQKADMRKMRTKVSAKKNKAEILHWECDNLANQFAEAVTTTTPMEGRVRGLDLENLLSNMGADPFSTRKQLPRTPESLIWDVKTSWRKAVEEDEAEKAQQSAKSHGDSTMALFSPIEKEEVSASPDASHQSIPVRPAATSPCLSGHPVHQQGVSLMSTLSSSSVEALHSRSGSDALHFSLDQETLPELLSLSDEALDSTSEEEEGEEELLLPDIPSLKTEVNSGSLTARQRMDQIRQAFSETSFMDGKKTKTTPEFLLSQHELLDLDNNTDWLTAASSDTQTSVAASGNVFSLDLDALESPSPPSKEQYSLPNLVTFSPIDDS